MSINSKKIEIFSGTGGVGKTTMATSRALHLAVNNKKILLITIDPAKRLKEVMSMSDDNAGTVMTLKSPIKLEKDYEIDVLLMSPDKTIEKIANKTNSPEVLKSRILKILTRPYGGLNEILSVVELEDHFEKGIYDTIVLDTPPGSHFLDFLESVEKIKAFFDESFIDIFNYLGKKVESSGFMSRSKKLVTMVVSSGVKKLLSYLQTVTGASFIDDFMDAIGAIYQTKDSFLSALQLQEKLKDEKFTNWFLVTSVDQVKIKEATKLQEEAKDFLNEKSYAVLNKCIQDKLSNWEPSESDEFASKLKTSLSKKEDELKNFMRPRFQEVLEFPEIFKVEPKDHVSQLVKEWNKYI